MSAAIRHLLWDAGGTLFDSYPAKVTAIRLAARHFGKAVPAARVRALLRESTRHTLRALAADLALDHAAFAAGYRDIYTTIGARRQPPFPGVRRICRYIVARGGQNFIITHRGRASLTRLLETHAMTDLFTDTITADDGFPRKPDPAALEAMLARHGLARSACLVIGDRDLDIEAGQRAGLRTCYFGVQPHTTSATTSATTSDTTSDTTPADVEVTTYAALYRWLAG